MAAQNDFYSTLDVTSLTSITQAQLQQLVNQIAPLSNIGLIIAQSTTPDVASNSRFAFYIWLDTSSSPPTPKYYNSGTTTWTAISVAAGSLTDAQWSAIAANGLTIAKLYPPAASGRYFLQMNSASTAWTAVAPTSALQSGDSVPVAALVNPGADGFLATYAGTVQWRTTAQAVTQIVGALTLPVINIDPTGNAGSTSVIGWNGTVVKWDLVNNWITNLALAKISQGGATTNQHLKWDGTTWAPVTLPFTSITSASTTGILSSVPLTSPTVAYTIPHGLSSTPKLMRVVMYCNANDAATGYSTGDEVPLEAISDGAGLPCVTYYADATNIYINVTTAVITSASVYYTKKAGSTQAHPTSYANFTPKIYAWA